MANKQLIGILLIGLSIFFLLWNLDGNPSPLRAMGSYNDETYWLHNSINEIEYGEAVVDTMNQAYFGAPLYNQLNVIWFETFDYSLWNARILPILFLLLTALLLYYILKPYVDKDKLLLYIGGFLILFETKLYYTTSTPVPMEMFFQAGLILYILRYRLKSLTNLGVALIITYAAILSKTTSVWLIGFVCIVYLYDNRNIWKTGLVGIVFVIPYILLNLLFKDVYPEFYQGYLSLVDYNININKDTLKQILNPLYYGEKLYGYFLYPTSWLLFAIPIYSIINKKKLIINRETIILYSYIFVLILTLLITDQLRFPRRVVTLTLPIYLLSVLYMQDNKSKKLFKYYIIINLSFHIIFLNI